MSFANLNYTWDRWNIYGNFTYVDATFRNAYIVIAVLLPLPVAAFLLFRAIT